MGKFYVAAIFDVGHSPRTNAVLHFDATGTLLHYVEGIDVGLDLRGIDVRANVYAVDRRAGLYAFGADLAGSWPGSGVRSPAADTAATSNRNYEDRLAADELFVYVSAKSSVRNFLGDFNSGCLFDVFSAGSSPSYVRSFIANPASIAIYDYTTDAYRVRCFEDVLYWVEPGTSFIHRYDLVNNQDLTSIDAVAVGGSPGSNIYDFDISPIRREIIVGKLNNSMDYSIGTCSVDLSTTGADPIAASPTRSFRLYDNAPGGMCLDDDQSHIVVTYQVEDIAAESGGGYFGVVGGYTIPFDNTVAWGDPANDGTTTFYDWWDHAAHELAPVEIAALHVSTPLGPVDAAPAVDSAVAVVVHEPPVTPPPQPVPPPPEPQPVPPPEPEPVVASPVQRRARTRRQLIRSVRPRSVNDWGADVPVSRPVANDKTIIRDFGGFALTTGGIAHNITDDQIEERFTPTYSPPSPPTED